MTMVVGKIGVSNLTIWWSKSLIYAPHLVRKLTTYETAVCLCQCDRTLPDARPKLSIKLLQLFFHCILLRYVSSVLVCS